jgi:hypothetical protein
MSAQTLHRRLKKWRERAWRRKCDLPVYAHMLVTAHSQGELIACDHPSWARLDQAIDAARAGDGDALDRIALEAVRLRDCL